MTNIPNGDPRSGTGPALKLFIGVVIGLWLALACAASLVGALVPSSAALAPTPVRPAATVVAPTLAPSAAAPTPAAPTAIPPTVEARTPTPLQPTPAPTLKVTPTGADAKRQLRVFRDLWETISTRYIYTNFNGLDWNRERQRVEQQIGAGMADDHFYDAMRGLVESLNDDHSVFLSPDEVKAEDREYAGQDEYTGIGILWSANEGKGYTFVLQTYSGSPAERSGIKAHDHILAVNGVPSVQGGQADMSRVRGPEGTTVTLTIRTPGGQPRDVVVTRGKISGATPIEHRLLPAGGSKRVGYLLVPTFFEEDVGNRVRQALTDLMKGGNLDGLIVDMRINGGGSYAILAQNLGFFTGGRVGELVNRRGRIQAITAVAERIGNSQSVPIAILVGDSTESYAEVFSGALRAKKRAVLVGTETAGNIETLRRHDFEDGSAAWIAEETFRLPDGTGWEGKGLVPDVRVELGWDEFTAETDPAVAAAVASLTGRK